MKLALFNDYIPAVVRYNEIVSIAEVVRPLSHGEPAELMNRLIARWGDYREAIEAYVAIAPGVPAGSVRLRAPTPRPSKIMCAAANYLEGIPGNISDLEFFHKSPSAIIGDGDTLMLPQVELTIVHHELELGVVMGRAARSVSEDEALDHVFGYLIFQDGSARGLLSNGQLSFFLMKNWDTFAPLGPWLVTADEIPDPHDLRVRLWANGELRQDYSTDDMAYRVPELIARLSAINTLLPGDIIATGCNRQGLGPLQHGDMIVQEISGLGKLTTHVEDPMKRSWPYGVDIEFAEFVRKPRAQRGPMGPPRIVPARSRA
jgi:2-keto-4-pentenoate hydratase/2-oxohepta-3-ene-1,7-dioic acid hydratase in catechol pathway